MVWTQNRIRSRLSLRRHRPSLEQLDERCLLSTGAGPSLPNSAASDPHAAALQAPIPARQQLYDPEISRSTTIKVDTVHTAQPATPLQRPAGTLLTGTPTAFDPIVGAAAARQEYGVDGTGMTVAVIDTGVDYNNPALGGGFGPNAKVVAGYDFATSTPDPMATSSQHGTAVAGLIGSDDPNNLGVAPGVKIVALRVTGSDNTASLSSIASALQWVVNNHSQYNITVVNMSLSDGGNYAQNWFAQDGGVGGQVTNLINQLQAMNIPVVSATGNSFTGQQGEGFTAIVAGVISVTATDTSGDQLLPDAQRLGPVTGMGTMTDLAAPGEGMVAPTGDSGYSSVEGTSFATPLVTGAVVLLQQIYQARFGTLPTVNQVTQWLEQGSDPIYDPVTGLTIGRLDIPKAAALIPSAASSPAPTAASASVTVSIPVLQTTPGITSTVTATTVSYVSASTPPVSTAATPSSTPPVSTAATPSSTPTASTATTPVSTPPASTATTSSSTPSASTATTPSSTPLTSTVTTSSSTPPASTLTTSSSIPPTSTVTTSSSTPSAGAAVVFQATSAPSNSGLSPNVQVFVNGEQVNSLSASQSSMLPSLPQANFASLLKAMSAWAAGTGNDQTASASVSQVHIWNAASQPSDLSPAGLIYPTGNLAVKMATSRRPVRR
ncbi:MAG: S8 family peptidase [Isosphaeraceae bacterium]